MAFLIRPAGDVSEVYGSKTGKVYFSGSEDDCKADIKRRLRNFKARMRNRAIASAMDSIGMVKVRGANGGTYWE